MAPAQVPVHLSAGGDCQCDSLLSGKAGEHNRKFVAVGTRPSYHYKIIVGEKILYKKAAVTQGAW